MFGAFYCFTVFYYIFREMNTISVLFNMSWDAHNVENVAKIESAIGTLCAIGHLAPSSSTDVEGDYKPEIFIL